MKTWRLKLWVVVCLGGSGIGCLGQTNVWTNSAGGSWEQPYWSAGILPGTNQTILFTNDEQTLTIGGATGPEPSRDAPCRWCLDRCA